MLRLSIPGRGSYELRYLVLDVNGTLTRDGELIPGVEERLGQLRTLLEVRLISADTFGRLDAVAARLGLPARRLSAGGPESEQKARFVGELGPAGVLAIGNGANDAGMLRAAAVGIAVMGPEGSALEALLAADVVVTSILDALDLVRFPGRLVATLRR
jgi:P-type E1-E2 ATPase